ncbi:Uncharacterised protein [Vibrio cholerae]|nr:Uncharacterised protein [Vibrio cholerae]CSD16150.1 Uncharacterised protein [Vibrio cholerae]
MLFVRNTAAQATQNIQRKLNYAIDFFCRHRIAGVVELRNRFIQRNHILISKQAQAHPILGRREMATLSKAAVNQR